MSTGSYNLPPDLQPGVAQSGADAIVYDAPFASSFGLNDEQPSFNEQYVPPFGLESAIAHAELDGAGHIETQPTYQSPYASGVPYSHGLAGDYEHNNINPTQDTTTHLSYSATPSVELSPVSSQYISPIPCTHPSCIKLFNTLEDCMWASSLFFYYTQMTALVIT